MIQKLHSLVWGPALLTLLLITGGLYTPVLLLPQPLELEIL